MLEVNNKDTRLGKVNDKDTVNVVLVSILNFGHISRLVTVFLLLTLIS